MDILSEAALVRRLADIAESHPRMIQIGANDGKTEYAKVGNKDFVFEFLLDNPRWSATLVEPLPEIFAVLKQNYVKHRNELAFLNCAVAEAIGYRELYVQGRDGKRSSLIGNATEAHEHDPVTVPLLDYRFLCRLVGWDRIDFVKIDAEGYDQIIVQSILACGAPSLIPGVIYWERGTRQAESACVEALMQRGFQLFRSGLNKRGDYMDRIAICECEPRFEK